MKIVDVDHLSFEYGNRRVLHNLNFSFPVLGFSGEKQYNKDVFGWNQEDNR